jgi:hypothetical protein
MPNCLRLMWGRKAVRLAFAQSRKTKKIGKAKCVPKCKKAISVPLQFVS